MTPPWREYVPCPACGSRVSTESAFDAWVRGHDRLDSIADGINITDGDKIVHRYMVRTGPVRDRETQYLMSVEIKTFETDMRPNQADTLHIWNQAIRTILQWREQRGKGRFLPGHRPNVANVYSIMNGREVRLECYGVHVLRLSGASPADSSWMTWDGKKIDTEMLVELLRFDRYPDSLRINDHRRHKRKPADHCLTLDLFDELERGPPALQPGALARPFPRTR